ncbi:MAG: adenylate/guanylate cyclase domain-containing protein, partial [Candidatus Eremiobacteraeota bacterium]|nr:adenylate/guanylate cyclase domain-containing protein [Candidatus Eremiobacteraeota bacterium]
EYTRFRASVRSGTLLFIGFIVAIGLLSLGLFLYLRESMFGFHALLMAVSILYILTANQLSWQYLWPSASIDSYSADAAAYTLYLLAIILFGRSFLSLRGHLSAFDRLLWGAFALNCLFTFVIEPIQPDSSFVNATTPLVNFAPLLLLLVAGIARLRSGFRQARFFVTGFGGMFLIFIVMGSIYRLAHLPYNAANLIISLSFDLGVAFDSLFFQFALADRVLSANRERDEAQRNELSAQQQALDAQRTAIETLERHNAAFTRFVPHAFLEQLGRADIVEVQLGDHVEREMAVLFSDIRSFTSLSERMTPRESFEFVNAFFAQVGPVVREHGGFIDKYIGDAVMALFSRRASDAIDAAIAVQREVRRFNEERARVLRVPIAVGIGAHWGKLILGTVGEERRIETTVVSDAVNVAARLQDLTKACAARIVVSGALVHALDDAAAYCLRAIGSFTVPGLSHGISVFEVCDADEPGVIIRKMSTRETFEEALRLYGTGEYERSVHLFESILGNNPDDGAAAYYRERASMDKALPEKLT